MQALSSQQVADKVPVLNPCRLPVTECYVRCVLLPPFPGAAWSELRIAWLELLLRQRRRWHSDARMLPQARPHPALFALLCPLHLLRHAAGRS
jgi:hypothetical protein